MATVVSVTAAGSNSANELAEGQSPKVMVIACSDSRSEPSQIFDTNPGEIFVVRNVAALVPPFETTPGRHGVSAALEFAVQFLKVEEIVVMGHGLCGGQVRREHQSIDNREAGRAMELAAVRLSLDNLMTFPCIQEKVRRGALTLRGAFFAISDGVLHVMDEATGEFSPA